MKIVLLSGGKGKRLWPVSTDNAPKQFARIFKDSSNMLERTINEVKFVETEDNIFIATCYEYKKTVKKYIHKKNIIIEPGMIGTFGAILNIAVHLKYNNECSEDEIVSVVPIDHDVDEKFYTILKDAKERIEESKTDICLIGINPTFPSTQYGYILTDNGYVKQFKEKPDINGAIELISENALWNSGLVVFRLKRILEIAHQYLEFKNYKEFNEKYLSLPHISFDYEVLEKEKKLAIVKSNSSWNDIGTWEVLADKIRPADEHNTNIINFEQKEIRNQGVENTILVNSPYGVLITPKTKQNTVYKTWGYYEIISEADSEEYHVKTKKLIIFPNRNISYQYHKVRCETWYVLSGKGEAIINGKVIKIKAGDVINIKQKEKHSIKASTYLEIIEVQHGKEKNTEEDIVRLELDWNKINLTKTK